MSLFTIFAARMWLHVEVRRSKVTYIRPTNANLSSQFPPSFVVNS